jgi:hypothetical protein
MTRLEPNKIWSYNGLHEDCLKVQMRGTFTPYGKLKIGETYKASRASTIVSCTNLGVDEVPKNWRGKEIPLYYSGFAFPPRQVGYCVLEKVYKTGTYPYHTNWKEYRVTELFDVEPAGTLLDRMTRMQAQNV